MTSESYVSVPYKLTIKFLVLFNCQPLVRCAWHGWEFEIAMGKYLYDPKIRVKSYDVLVKENGDVVGCV